MSKVETKEKQAFYVAMGEYQSFVESAGIVQAVCIGGKPGLRTGYIWNVLVEDLTSEQMVQDARLNELSEQAAVPIARSKGCSMPLRIANVLPSRFAPLISRYEQSGFKLVTKRISSAGVDLPPYNPDLTVEEAQQSLDVLIGGLEPCDARLVEVHREAASAVRDFGENTAQIEEAFSLDIFDKLRDRQAGTMLKDIALVKNARIKGGFVRALELKAEPIRVFQEIMLNVFDDETMHGITVLDVRGAIESGVLSTF